MLSLKNSDRSLLLPYVNLFSYDYIPVLNHGRVVSLTRRVYRRAGSVRKAARLLGVSKSSVHRIVSGQLCGWSSAYAVLASCDASKQYFVDTFGDKLGGSFYEHYRASLALDRQQQQQQLKII